MARSDAEICNIALQRVGVTMTIDTLEQRVKEAAVCNLIYTTTRDRVLAAGRWPFARKYQVLNLSEFPAPAKWRYRYIYPNDCLSVRSLFPDLGAGADPFSVRQVAMVTRIPYELVLDNNGDKTICTDLPDAILEYTIRITNPMRFDAAFDSAFAWAVAAEIALPLARDVKYAQNAAMMFRQEIGEALANGGNEEKADLHPESEFVRARS